MNRYFSPPPEHPALSRQLDELAVELTTFCNLKCKMCSVWEIRKKGVATELARTLLRDARSLGAHRFTPCGAESFMRPDFLDIVEYAESIGYEKQEIVTNGTLLEAEHFDRLEQLRSVSLHISIDGPREVHDELRGEGNFDKSVGAVRECVERGIAIGVSGVIMRETIRTLTGVVDLAAELGLPEISLQPFQIEISGPDKDLPRFSLRNAPREEIVAELERIVEHAEKRGVKIYTESLFGVVPDYLAFGKRPIPPGGCYLPSKFLLVDWRGDIYPCFFMRTEADRMGNVHDVALPEVWHSIHHRQLQVLALTERCPGCLAACSDVETFDYIRLPAGKEPSPPKRGLPVMEAQ